ncbi:unnamed protein product [Allacma fusca]|uniref:Senescence domain-containing protein n=1 Tax=Allacma fusca TaxID=39272 RepID=A0A8J2P602_9HEXA|nr:unnamed protein product [Allacma fusca]
MEQEAPQAAPRRRNNNVSEDVVLQLQIDETPYEGFMKVHTQAYASTKEGTILDEEGFKDKAFNSYQKALELIDKALQISYGGGFSSQEVNKVDEIVYKMRMTRKEILERVSDLQHSAESPSYLEGPSAPSSLSAAGPNFSVMNRQPPAYSVGNFDGVTTPPCSLAGGSIPLSPTTGVPPNSIAGSASSLYGNLSSVLDEIASSQSIMPNPLPINAHEILFIENEVQIYFISPDGNVSAPSYPSFLRVVVTNEEPENSQPGAVTTMADFPAFIQCGDWIYPLVKNQSPVYKSSDGTYLFPDLTSPIPGASVGLILPLSYSEESRTAFEDSILQLVGLHIFPGAAATAPEVAEPTAEQVPAGTAPKPPPRKLGSMIAEGAEAISKGLQIGAEKTSTYLDKGATYLVTKIDPAKTKTEISPAMKSRIKTAKHVTGKAVQVSGYLVTQLSRGTVKLGQYLAPHIQSKATQLYASATKTNEEKASEKVNQVLDVASGAFTGFSIVYSGLEDAAKVLANSLANNTVQVVNHRYGSEAGDVVGDATETVGNCVVTGYNAKMFGPKAVIKRAAKDTGKAALVKGPKPSKGSPSGMSPPK